MGRSSMDTTAPSSTRPLHMRWGIYGDKGIRTHSRYAFHFYRLFGWLTGSKGFDWVPLKRIDYLFVAPHDHSPWTIEGYAVLETKYEDGIASSDHRPVMVDLTLH